MHKADSARLGEVWDSLLGTVQRPGRYCGGERNAVKKDPSNVLVRFALVFPDVYEIGMSHIGLKILYEILNRRERSLAERVFLPWRDFAAALRRQGILLSSLESKLPLSEFDVVGFSLQHELCYTNVLEVLDLGGIPVRASQRGPESPLVIGGGPCAFNPEPLWEFFDFFVVGDGEEVVERLAEIFEDQKVRGWDRAEAIRRASQVEGVYVPSDYQMRYSGLYVSGIAFRGKEYQDAFAAPRVKRALVDDLESATFPSSPVVPNIEVVHDRAAVEIMRGCSRGCRFCQAGYICRPARERSLKTVVRLAELIAQKTGYGEISFLSLSSGDYSAIEELILRVVARLSESKVAVSLPSLRVDSATDAILQGIRQVKKTGFTLAPEAGTERLRSIINKPTTDEMILLSAQRAFAAGWKRVKLYFMIGLPGETDEDIDAIVRLAKRLARVARRAGGAGGKVAISLSTFIPKPHTPFQWCRQSSIEEAAAKISHLKKELGSRNLELKWHLPQMSFLEGVLSRGDRRLSQVIHRGWRLGCLWDGWTEQFDFDKWMRAFDECRISPQNYTGSRELDRFLPWEHIDSGVAREFLVAEKHKSDRQEVTADCRASGVCQQCGVCADPQSYLAGFARRLATPDRKPAAAVMRSVPGSAKRGAFAVRCRYERTGPARFISHLDVMTAFGRALRQSGLPIDYSRGFNPQPRLSAGLPLPIGYASLAEYVDFRFTRPVAPSRLVTVLNEYLMEGMRLVAASHLVGRPLSLCSVVSELDYSVVIDTERLSELLDEAPRIELGDANLHRQRVSEFLARKSLLVSKTTPKRSIELDLRALVASLRLEAVRPGKVALRMTLKVQPSGRTAKPEMVLQALYGIRKNVLYFAKITRLEQYCWRRGRRCSLLELASGQAARMSIAERMQTEL